VLTDGTLWLDAQGVELKGFSIRDGLAVRLWQRAGHRFGLITARSSQAVKLRAAELGITLLRQGSPCCVTWAWAWPWPTPRPNCDKRPTWLRKPPAGAAPCEKPWKRSSRPKGVGNRSSAATKAARCKWTRATEAARTNDPRRPIMNSATRHGSLLNTLAELAAAGTVQGCKGDA